MCQRKWRGMRWWKRHNKQGREKERERVSQEKPSQRYSLVELSEDEGEEDARERKSVRSSTWVRDMDFGGGRAAHLTAGAEEVREAVAHVRIVETGVVVKEGDFLDFYVTGWGTPLQSWPLAARTWLMLICSSTPVQTVRAGKGAAVWSLGLTANAWKGVLWP